MRTRIALGAAVVVVLAVVAGGRWWRGHPPEAFDGGPSFRFSDTRAGGTYYVGLDTAKKAPPRVRVTSYQPRLSDTTGARVRLMECTIAPKYGAGVLSAKASNIRKLCSELSPVLGHEIATDPVHSQVLLEVTPRRSGIFKMGAIDVSYDVGHQHGTQRVPVEIVLKPRA